MHIFLSTGLGPSEAARQLATAFSVEPVERDGNVYVALRRDDAEVGGEVKRNIFGAPPDPEPDEVSALDGYDVVWEIRRIPADEDARAAAARQLFDEIIERLPWPALLVDSLSTLVAAWHPNVGRTDFPAGTTPDATDQELWQSYAVSA
ncbi:hypothetical protein AB0M20_19710 [Actinoplanes sp. NPDC051633]|uniref:hypothetical protein n=1 Tax=Actinoplanes sp. NPDC051633 TaxID=3155670 RepID=UPI00343BE50E